MNDVVQLALEALNNKQIRLNNSEKSPGKDIAWEKCKKHVDNLTSDYGQLLRDEMEINKDNVKRRTQGNYTLTHFYKNVFGYEVMIQFIFDKISTRKVRYTAFNTEYNIAYVRDLVEWKDDK